jgi:hypothetical protein
MGRVIKLACGFSFVALLFSAPVARGPVAGSCSDECDRRASDCVDACEARYKEAKARVECKVACIAARETCDKGCK